VGGVLSLYLLVENLNSDFKIPEAYQRKDETGADGEQRAKEIKDTRLKLQVYQLIHACVLLFVVVILELGIPACPNCWLHCY
jgi:hypothetical protein